MSKELHILQHSLGVTKYEAACRLEWKFNERAIRKILESGGRRMAA